MTATSKDLPQELYGYAAMHLAMRRDASRLMQALAATPVDTASMRRWWRQFRDVIVRHHQREDELIWPALAAADPTFTDDIAAMQSDHAALDAAMDRLDAALSALVAEPHSRPEAQRAAEEFARVLGPHLEAEEAAAFHRLAQHRAMWVAVEREIERGMRTQAAFEVPWVFEGLPPAHAAHLRARAPWPLRPLLRLVWEPRYRRLVAAAHGTRA